MLVFYTGNTFHQPDDVFSLSGDRVGAETRRVTLAPVVNQRTSAAACHAQPAYNVNAATSAFFPVSVSAQTEPAIDAEILQATEDSIKLRMPAQAGIYQANLYGAAGELLQSVWLNLPQFETVLGDSGDSASPGGLIRLAGYRLCPADAPLPAEVRLRSASQTVTLSPESQDAPYALSVRLPADIPEGEYEAFPAQRLWRRRLLGCAQRDPRPRFLPERNPPPRFQCAGLRREGCGCLP